MVRALICCMVLTVTIVTSCKKDDTSMPGTRGNKPPVADAGPEQTIMKPRSNTILSGHLSHDPDGSIVSYEWKTVAGPDSPNMDKSLGLKPYEVFVYNLNEGVYQFELMVTDDDKATSRDTMKLTVIPDPLTTDPSKMKRFDSLVLGESCAIRIGNISSTILSSGSIQVFLQRYYGGGFMAGPFYPPSEWYHIQPLPGSWYWYEINNDVLIIHAAANIICDWDDGLYDVIVRWN